jgi:Cd2+/Zn2+-exporting ATPase
MPPDALLDRLSNEHQQLMETLRRGMNALYTARNEDRLWTLGSEESINSYAENMIANTQHEAMLVLTDANLRRLRGVIVEADARGVDIGALLTGEEKLEIGQVSYHPPRESQLHKLADSLIVVVDEQEVLIASSQPTSYTATVTTNANMVQIGRQFVWMELFAHRIFSQLGEDVLKRLPPEDRSVLESMTGPFEVC